MGKSANQKLKLLYLAKMFFEKTDESHSLTMADIISNLEKNDITAERKSLYDDFNALRNFGIEVETIKGKTTSYYTINDNFQIAELKLLVDAVQSSKFISQKKSRELIKKIQGLCSEHEAKTLQRQVYVSGRVKTLNENVYYNVDSIYTAIGSDKKISFNYFSYSIDKKEMLKRDGKKYEVDPLALIWDDENYYLVAFDTDKIKHFRVDKIISVDILDEARNKEINIREEDFSLYSNRVFSMFGGRKEKVRLKLDNYLIGVLIDRFGKEIIVNKYDETSFTVNIDVEISNQFFGWLVGLGKSAVILSPQSVKEEYTKHIKDILNNQ